jgi:hypothetical protein
MPRTGSLGIVLTAGIGLGMAGAVGVPLMGKLADRLPGAVAPAGHGGAAATGRTRSFPNTSSGPRPAGDLAALGYRQREVEEALAATRAALETLRQTGSINHDGAANALRAIVATAVPNEPLVTEANAILQPAEAAGGQRSFRYVAPVALLLILVFGAMYLADRRRGGYRAVALKTASVLLLLGALAPGNGPGSKPTRGAAPGALPGRQRAPPADSTGEGAPAGAGCRWDRSVLQPTDARI